MTIPELATPFRLYWDPVPEPAVHPDYAALCQEIVALKFLAVDVTDTGSAISTVTRRILASLADAPLRLTVTVSCEAFAGFCREQVPCSNRVTLLVQAHSLAELADIAAHLSRQRTGRQIGISWPLGETAATDLPKVAAICAGYGITQLVIPMQRLAYGRAPFIPDRKMLAQLADNLAGIHSLTQVNATIHDPFLWRAFHKDSPFPEGRCQAANTMVFLAADGTVYPCPEMPVALGSVLHDSLSMIVRGEKRREVRRRLRELPAECRCCAAADACFGGCRGRGLAVTGGWDGPDPGCS